MASKQKRTRAQVRDHELDHLQKLQAAGIGRMKNDSDVQAALGRYMRNYDFKAGIGAHTAASAFEHKLGTKATGIMMQYALAGFRILDKKHNNAEATRDAIEKEIIPAFLKKYALPNGDFTAAMKDLENDIIKVGQSVLSGTQDAQEVPTQH